MDTQTPMASVPTKYNIQRHVNMNHPTVLVSYNGRTKTFHLTGEQAEKAELSLLKAFPTMPFKTASQLKRLPYPVRTWYFKADGSHTDARSTITVFECQARNIRNARRKYGNYITSLTATQVTAKS